MIITFVTLTNDAKKVPVWKCAKDKNGKFAFFVKTSVVPKRIMVLGPIDPSYTVSEASEVQPNVFISKLELPYADLLVAGDDLRPFAETYDPKAPHKNVVVFLLDRSAYTFLDAATAPSAEESTPESSIILNTFHTEEWAGCIAVIGAEFKRGNYNPPRMVGMYIDYAVNGAPRASMLREMCIKGNPKGISITDGGVDDSEVAKRLVTIYKGPKKKFFRIRTAQRLTQYVIYPAGEAGVEDLFREAPADYMDNPFEIMYFAVPVDDNGNVIEDDYVKNTVLKTFERNRTNKNRSAVFYNCRPSSAFFQVNLSYVFVANKTGKSEEISYMSLVCP